MKNKAPGLGGYYFAIVDKILFPIFDWNNTLRYGTQLE